MTIPAQDVQDVRSAHKAGAQTSPVLFHHLRQCVRCFLRVLRQTKINRQHMFRLGSVIRECRAERGGNILMKRLIRSDVFPQQFSGFDCQLC